MSWKDKIENGVFKITTGDGKVYKPLFKTGESSIDFNVSSYNFINLEGTLVDRKQPQSGKYPLVFWFQGDDNIEQTEKLLKSAKDPRAWEVEHPLYGIINGQPLSIGRNDASLNITEIKVDFWESITVDFPDDEISVQDRIQAKALDVQKAGIKSFAVFKPTAANISTMKLATNQTKGSFAELAGDLKVKYQNAHNTAVKAIDKVVSAQELAIAAVQELFTLPLFFDQPIFKKIKAFEASLVELVDSIQGKNDKYFYESQAATGISAVCQCAVNPQEDDYISRAEIEKVADSILKMYADYLQVLDDNRVDQYEVEKTWNPNANLQAELSDLVIDTIANLQVLAFEAKQERVVYTEKDTNLIILTHRYLGLDANDENMERFRKINNIKNNELFLVRKGRKIKYFA